MVARALHYVSIVCCVFVAVSFLLFAHAQTSHASRHQANLIATPAQRAAAQYRQGVALIHNRGVTPAAHRPGQPRRFIDGVAGKLTAPFSSIVPSDDARVKRGVPALSALLVYGAGLGFLSRWTAGRTD